MFTTQPIENAVRLALFSEGYIAVVYSSPFSTYQQEAIDSESNLYKFNPDLILSYVALRDFLPDHAMIVSAEQIKDILQEQENHWKMIWRSINEKCNAKVIQHTFVSPDTKLCGIAESKGFFF